MSDIKNLSTSTKYKETPIGEIPVDWGVVKLGEVAEIGSGDSAPQDAKYFENGQYLFIRTSDVGKVSKCHRFVSAQDKINDLAVKELGLRQWPKGTILFPKSGASTFLNHRVLLSKPAYVSSHLAAIVANNNAVSEFLYYCLLTTDAKSLVPDTNYPSLRLGDLASIHVPLPPLPEQEKIAEVLTSVDDTIEKTQQLIEQAKKLQNTLMHNLLTHGIPGSHQKYKKTIYGVVPDDWSIVRLGEICKFEYGEGLREHERTEGSYPVYGSNGIVGFHDSYLVKGPGIVVGRKGSVGEVHYVNEDFWPIDTTYYIVCSNRMHIAFLYRILLHIRLDQLESSSAVPGLNRKDAYAKAIPLPPLSEQEKISNIISSFEMKVKSLILQKSQFEILKQGLMQVLLTGKVRLKNASL